MFIEIHLYRTDLSSNTVFQSLMQDKIINFAYLDRDLDHDLDLVVAVEVASFEVDFDSYVEALDIVVDVMVGSSFVHMDRCGVDLVIVFFPYRVDIIIVLVRLRQIVSPHQRLVQRITTTVLPTVPMSRKFNVVQPLVMHNVVKMKQPIQLTAVVAMPVMNWMMIPIKQRKSSHEFSIPYRYWP